MRGTKPRDDVFEIAASTIPQKAPYTHIDCGAQDSLLEINRSFAALILRRHIAHESHEVPAAHEWEYWNRRIQYVVRFLGARCPEIKSTNARGDAAK
jgi:S-formylglutathione hydrolase FrmB